MHAGDRHPTFANSSGATLHRSGAHIARRKNTWAACLQRTRRTFALRPCWRMGNCGSGLNKAFLIAFDLARQPICAGRRTNHGKDRWRLRHTALARLRILQLDRFEHFVTAHSSNLSVAQELDALVHLHTPREIARHAF